MKELSPTYAKEVKAMLGIPEVNGKNKEDDDDAR